jgi:endoribonuclease LACTB2
MAAKVIPKISKLTPSVIRILGCNPGKMTLQGTNCYLIGTGPKRLLLDAGDAKVPEFVKNLQSVLTDEGAEIKDIVVTHWHHDHVGGELLCSRSNGHG